MGNGGKRDVLGRWRRYLVDSGDFYSNEKNALLHEMIFRFHNDYGLRVTRLSNSEEDDVTWTCELIQWDFFANFDSLDWNYIDREDSEDDWEDVSTDELLMIFAEISEKYS